MFQVSICFWGDNQLNNDELNRTANIGILRQLHRDELINDQAFKAACQLVRPASEWFFWTRQVLQYLGSALMLAGVIFFFAYNWAEMGRFLKFGLIETAILICVVASFLKRKSELSSKVLLLCASILVGVLLAVYGQVYQTGADAYGLFVGWAILIVGWVVISEFAALWFVWLLLLNIGAAVYWWQVGSPAHSIRYEYLCLVMTMLNSGALVLREAGFQCGLTWLKGAWLRAILLSAMLGVLSLPVVRFIFDFEITDVTNIIIACIWIGVVAGSYFYYRFKLPDIISLSLIVLNVCTMLLTIVGKVLFEHLEFRDGGPFLLFTFAILGVVTGAAYWLKMTAESMQNELNGIETKTIESKGATT